MNQSSDFDIIVVGAGHAGIEACLVSAKKGLKTAMVTTNMQRIGFMSCNPSIGGLAKGHMVRELDVLGGTMGRVTDETCIQFKRLNARKGPAVRGSRAQCDKDMYSSRMHEVLENQPNLELIEGEVKRLVLTNDQCEGVVLQDGSAIKAKAVIITAGTFLNAVMHFGEKQIAGGRIGDQAAVGLSDQIRDYGFEVQRFKTGTPPRLMTSTIDWEKTDPQYGDKEFYPFSFFSADQPALKQVACYLTHTNERTHEIINNNLHRSPIYGGIIEGTGPRYCPSIEDKVVRFAERISHQTFLEPETVKGDSIYLQGISTSLPEDVQLEFLRTIRGLENVKLIRPGYAVEYDYILPTQIRPTLETRNIQNLFLAGQVNGTSGYEEAAAQGFVAGANAVAKIMDREEFVMLRSDSYIGVLIDDLITKGTLEPYRMFTSRAEHRLHLREDNTIDRLIEWSSRLGVQNAQDLEGMHDYMVQKSGYMDFLRTHKVVPNEKTLSTLNEWSAGDLKKPLTLEELLRRESVESNTLKGLGFDLQGFEFVEKAVEIEVKYKGYIDRELEHIRQTKKMETFRLDESIDYGSINGLSSEEREKLIRVRPRTVGQAQRISGVNPSAIQAILVHLRGRNRFAQKER